MLRRDLVVDVEAEVELEAELREPADRVLGDDPDQVREPVENAIEDQVGKCQLHVETSHHEALRRHVLDHVVVLPPVGDDSLGERTDVERRCQPDAFIRAHTGSKSG